MNLVFKSPTQVPDEAGNDFSLLAVCGDPATTDRAFDVLRLLGKQLKTEPGRLFYQWWNFEFLSLGELQELFRAEAAAADMIIVSFQSHWDLPALVANLKDWLPGRRQRRPGALVALLDGDPNQAQASEMLLSQLEQAAVASHMDFFAAQAKEAGDAEMEKKMNRVARQFAEGTA